MAFMRDVHHHHNVYSTMSKLFQGAGLSAVGIASYFWGRSSAPTKTDKPTPSSNLPASQPADVPAFPGSPVKPEGFYKYGFPGPVHDLQQHDEFIACYNRATRNPYWVLEHLTQESLRRGQGVDRKKSIFKEDESIPLKFRARLRDYFRSGYDRGHLAPAADAKFSQHAMDETFFLTNMSPQVGDGFNRNYWAHLEDFVRRLTSRYDSVRVLTGPLYLPKQDSDDKFRVSYEVVGSPPNVAVPTHFFKLIVGEREGSDNLAVGAFVLPNAAIDDSTPLTQFQVPVEAVERSAGLELLHRVPPQAKRDLCRETRCEIIVRDFSQATKALPPGKSG